MFIGIIGFDGYFVNKKGDVMGRQGKILKPADNGTGYKIVILRKGNKSYARTVHRLVAEAFIENPDNLPEVNHKDENKANNSAENLEWCSHRYNNKYGTKVDRGRKTRAENGKQNKRVICVETNKVYKSIAEAASELNICLGDISRACRKVRGRKKCGGYHWAYV